MGRSTEKVLLEYRDRKEDHGTCQVRDRAAEVICVAAVWAAVIGVALAFFAVPLLALLWD